MKIYLIRNAVAVAANERLEDERRYLSAAGRQVARGVGARLSREGVEVSAVLTSPFVRAVQTAELIAERIDYVGVIASSQAMLPDAQPAIAAKEIVALGGDVAVVGHEPMISNLTAFLSSRPGSAPFRHGQVTLLCDKQPEWKLLPHTLEIEVLNTPG